MSTAQDGLTRRGFLQRSAGGGMALGSLLSLGTEKARGQSVGIGAIKVARAHQVPSICPYCAVGCAQIVTARDGQIVNIEGNPDSPINRGTLCPKGAATFQLAVNPNRITKVWYRAPGATDWDKTKTLDWAMERIAHLVKETRDKTFQETWQPPGDDKKPAKRVNHTLAIASLGGATMDNEWNYVQAKLLRALGVVFIENQARI